METLQQRYLHILLFFFLLFYIVLFVFIFSSLWRNHNDCVFGTDNAFSCECIRLNVWVCVFSMCTISKHTFNNLFTFLIFSFFFFLYFFLSFIPLYYIFSACSVHLGYFSRIILLKVTSLNLWMSHMNPTNPKKGKRLKKRKKQNYRQTRIAWIEHRHFILLSSILFLFFSFFCHFHQDPEWDIWVMCVGCATN